MRKKNEKLKAEIKKEILKELEDEEKKGKEKNKTENLQPIELPKIEHTKEDIYEIRKSFLKIFLFAGAALFIIIIIIINPFGSKKDKLDDDQVIEEKVEKEEPTLITREDGIIENSNEELFKLFSMVTPQLEEYYLYDSTYLYSKQELLVKDTPVDYLLFLLSKTESFQNMINTQFGETSAELCIKNGVIKISVEEINKMLESYFDVSPLQEYPEFKYMHYFNYEPSTIIRFVYSDGYYVSFCEQQSTELKYNSVAYPVIKEAVKEKEYIKITAKVAFSTSEKIYADYELTEIISDNIEADILDYINKANEYQYIFKLNNNKYKLEKIIKVN